jgi:uncharacterized protein YeaO (DUF488 family)
MPFRLKRAYEPAARADGKRVLVERLWPRGVSNADLRLDDWLKDVAPSTALRKWFSHDPEKWNAFQLRYRKELDANREAWQPLLALGKRNRVTLVYSSHDEEHNNAVALKQYLDSKLRKPASRG